MKMRHKTTGMRHNLDNLNSQQIGFYGRNTITFDSLYLIQCFYQIKETLSCCFTKISDIHSGQNDFFSAFSSCLPRARCLGDR